MRGRSNFLPNWPKCFATKAESFDHHEKLMREATAGGANIVVTQELFLTPYFCTVEDPARFSISQIRGPVRSTPFFPASVPATSSSNGLKSPKQIPSMIHSFY